MITVYFDGCCEPKNPGGHAAWGALVQVDGETVWSGGGYCGVGSKMSNNVAEYSGFCAGLERALEFEGQIHIYGDSRLVICHLFKDSAKRLGYRGKWKVGGGLYMPFYIRAKELLDTALLRGRVVTADWIPREKNDLCDVLSKKVLKDMGVTFKIQPEAA